MPMQTQQRQPGLFSQMAATAAGVAVGSSVGHAVGGALGGVFGGGQQPQYAEHRQEQAAPDCSYLMNQFEQCMKSTSEDFSQCKFFYDQFTACKK